jgi:hypothetical protein
MSIIALLVYIYMIYVYSDNIIVKSKVDEQFYSVRNLYDALLASDLLAKINKNIETLVLHLVNNKQNYPNYAENIDLLQSKYKSLDISENPHTNNGTTSFSVNKKKIYLCLRNKQDELHDINLIMYVVIHELAHVACPVYDNHGSEFQRIFKWLLDVSHKINIYTPNSNASTEYCGMKL